jgi:NAD(P)-dependent dehydrogenase (short-subunit alcohol dehydrogenase family)
MTTPSKIALVTGGNKGIGRAIVAGLAAQGYTVLMGTRDLDHAPDLPGDVRPVQLDVTSQPQVDALARHVETEFGRLDVLVNNAGVHPLLFRPLDRIPRPTEELVEDYHNVYEVNVFAVVRMMNAFLPLLDKSDAPRVVNVTSMRGSLGEPGAWVGQPSMVYSSSKTALNALTAHYAREFAGTKLKINGAAPGHVATDFNGHRGTRTPEEGAAVVIRLATVDGDGPSGEVFQDDTKLAW